RAAYFDSGFELSFSAVMWTTTTTTTTTPPPPPVPCKDITLNKEQRIMTFTSPFYPNLYPANYHCDFRITSPEGTRIFMAFETLKVEYTEKCTKDYVQIEGLKDYFGVKMCGTKLPPSWMTLVSVTNTVDVTFHSDDAKQLRGFKMFIT
ncbi:CUB domain, partial [Trinorchestia longiramus]